MNNEATRAQLRRVPLAGALTVALRGAGVLSGFAPISGVRPRYRACLRVDSPTDTEWETTPRRGELP